MSILSRAWLMAVAAAFIAFQLSCQHQQNAPQTSAKTALSDISRTPASIDRDKVREQALQRFLTQKNGEAVYKSDYLDRTMLMFYRVESNIQKYEKFLDDVLAKQKKDPNYSVEIMQDESYQKNIIYLGLRDRLMADIEYSYRRLYEIQRDPSSSESAKTAAGRILAFIHSWIEGLEDEDRAIALELLNNMQKIRATFKTADNRTGFRTVASVGAEFDFNKYTFSGKSDLSSYFKSHRRKIQAKARAAETVVDPEADFRNVDFAQLAKENARREPSSPEPYRPDTGTYGNINGISFAPNTFVFTFDDGPVKEFDDEIFPFILSYKDSVNANGIPESFFWMVIHAQDAQETIDKAKSLGFPLNNHSWDHPDDYIFLGQDGWNKQINQAQEFLTKAYGFQPVLHSDKFKYYRCPYGACIPSNLELKQNPIKGPNSEIVRKMIADLGLIHVHWCIDSSDWANPNNPERTFDITTKSMQIMKRGVILMHDRLANSVVAFKNIASWIKDQNDNHDAKYRLISLDQAVQEHNAQFKTTTPQ